MNKTTGGLRAGLGSDLEAACPPSWALGPRATGHTGDTAGSPGRQGGCRSECGATLGSPCSAGLSFPTSFGEDSAAKMGRGLPGAARAPVAGTRPRFEGQDLNYCAEMSAAPPAPAAALGASSRSPARNASLRNHVIAGCHAVTLDRLSAPPR